MPTIRGDYRHITADSLRPYLGENLAPYAEAFVAAGHANGLDPRFLASVSLLETGNGTSPAFRRGNNAMGISTRTGPRYDFASVSDSIHQQARSLGRADGYYAGANTIDEIGAIYAPPGAENDRRGTNERWPDLVAQNYRAMTAGDAAPTAATTTATPGTGAAVTRALPTADTADTLEAPGARDAMTPDLGGDGVPRDALTQGPRRAEPERQPAQATIPAAAPGVAPIPKWSEVKESPQWRHASQSERRAALERYFETASQYLAPDLPEAERARYDRNVELERLRMEYEDPEATILDAFNRGLLTTKSARELGRMTKIDEEAAAMSAELARVRLKLRPGEAIYAGPAKTMDLRGERGARVLAGTQEQGIYAVPPTTPGSMSLEEYAADIQTRQHAAAEARKAALAASLEAGDLAKALPESRAVREFTESKTGQEAAEVLLKNFIPIATHTLAESAPGIVAPVTGGAVGGLVGGPAGAVAGGATGGFAVEYSASYRDFLNEAATAAGLDPATPEGLLAAIRSPEIVAEARNRAALRGVLIAAVDALTAGLASKLGTRLGAQIFKNVAMDPASGAAGEFAAQAASGQPIDPKAATLEGIGQAATGAGGTVTEIGRAMTGRGETAAAATPPASVATSVPASVVTPVAEPVAETAPTPPVEPVTPGQPLVKRPRPAAAMAAEVALVVNETATPSPATAPVEIVDLGDGEIPLGLDRPSRRDEALASLPDDAFYPARQAAMREERRWADLFDERELSREERQAFAEAQDRATAMDLELYRREAIDTHPEDLMRQMRQEVNRMSLLDEATNPAQVVNSEAFQRFGILVEEVQRQGGMDLAAAFEGNRGLTNDQAEVLGGDMEAIKRALQLWQQENPAWTPESEVNLQAEPVVEAEAAPEAVTDTPELSDPTGSDLQSDPVSSETPAAEPAPDSTAPQRAQVRRRNLDRSDTPILNFVRENPLLSPGSPKVLDMRRKLKRQKEVGGPAPFNGQDFLANFNGYPNQRNYKSGARQFLRGTASNTGLGADDVAAMAVRRGLLPEGSKAGDLYEAMHREMQWIESQQEIARAAGGSLKGGWDENNALELRDEMLGRQRSDFEADTNYNYVMDQEARLDGKKPPRRRPEAIQGMDLMVGDILTVRGEKLEVTETDGPVITLSDGKRYGVQQIEVEDQLFVDEVELVERPERAASVSFLGPEDDPFAITRPVSESAVDIEDPTGVNFAGVGILTPAAARVARGATPDAAGRVKTRQGLPLPAFEAKLNATGRRNAILKRVEQTQRRLDYLVSKVTRRGFTSLAGFRSREQVLQAVQNFLTGALPIDQLPAELRAIAAEMRTATDTLSQELIDEGVIEGDLVAIVTGNRGTYLNRSYRVFDDPKWAERVPEPVRNRAKGLLRQQYPRENGESLAAYANRIDWLIGTLLYNKTQSAAGPIAAMAEASDTGRMVRQILRKRGDIPVELRELWGEYTTADVSWARTMAKMAQLLASHQYLSEIREAGLGKFLFDADQGTPPPWATRQIVSTTRDGGKAQAMAPLANLWTSPEVAAALEASVNHEEAGVRLYRLYMWLNGVAKMGKTVFNPITHVRNFTANPLIVISMGNIPLRHSTKAMRAFMTDLLPAGMVEGLQKVGLDAPRWRDYVRELVERGVLGENVSLGDLSATMKEAVGGKMTMDEFIVNRYQRLGRKALGFPIRLYGAEDGFWRIVSYEAEAGKLRRAFPDRSEAEIRDEAAMLVRESMPTYSLVPELLNKYARRSPIIGPFVSFWAEIIRTQVFTMQRAKWEMATDGYRAIGARRLAGLLVAHSIPIGLAMLGKLATGTGDDEERAARRLMAPWDQNALGLFLGHDDKGNVRFWNTSYIDPFALFKKPFIAWMRDDYASTDDLALAMLAEAFGPLVQEEILTSALLDLSRNKDGTSGRPIWNERASLAVKLQAWAAHLGKAFEPGFIATGDRIYKAVTGEQTRTGRAYNLGDEVRALATGQRIVTIDPLDSVGFRASDFREGWSQSAQIFTEVATSKGRVTPEALQRQYGEMMAARTKLAANLTQDLAAAIRLGVSVESVTAVAESRGAGEANVAYALQGQMAPYVMSDATFKRAAEIPGRLADIAQAVGMNIFTPKQAAYVQQQRAAGLIAIPGQPAPAPQPVR